ncbi:hypothetical protein IFM89_037530 [Coptis chinensis]|uniref:Alpha/beta hydrolase fold-3 domain-containing protein n=1 Tax=Coptis chinensis TaxID=261450 RepID=A0A835I0R5_9MAGN|nr:hypothetical protein IFM89_037530 [Coptis chinensis]
MSFSRLFDPLSNVAGANIVHNIAMPAGEYGLIHGSIIFCAFLGHPYFWGSCRIGSEDSKPDLDQKDFLDRNGLFVSPYGIDDPKNNPMGPNAPSLAGLGCTRVLVSVAANDILRDRGRLYCDELRKSGWKGEVELFEVDGENHAFHIFDPDCENAVVFKHLASFLNHP